MPIVGKKLRSGVEHLLSSLVQRGGLTDGAPLDGNPLQAARSAVAEDDDPRSTPGAAAERPRHRRQCANRSTRDVDHLQLAVRQEAERSAVRRPERERRPGGFDERLRRRRIQRPQPDLDRKSVV